ncbi:MAG: hypothetical protein V3U84_02755 [Thiotrichaceae bacterium]
MTKKQLEIELELLLAREKDAGPVNPEKPKKRHPVLIKYVKFHLRRLAAKEKALRNPSKKEEKKHAAMQ